MIATRSEYTFDRVVRMVLTGIVLTALFFLLRYLSDVLLPFAAAAVLAYMLNPLVTVFERKTGSRALAVGMTLFGILLVLTTAVVIGVPLIASQVTRFQRSIGRLRADLMAGYTQPPPVAEDESSSPPSGVPATGREPGSTGPVAEATDVEAEQGKFALGWVELSEGWARYRREANEKPRAQRLGELRHAVDGTFIGKVLDDAVAFTATERFRELALGAVKTVAVGGLSVVGFFVNFALGLIGLVIVIVYLIFLLIDFPQYSRTWPSLIPAEYRVQVVDFYTQFNFALRQYLRGQAIVAAFTGLLYAAGFTIIGLPMAVPFGLMIGVLNMVPYLPAVAIVPALLLAVLRSVESDASLLGSVLLIFLIFGCVQVIQDTLVTPRVMGQATGLRPVAILLGIFIWGKLLGFLGLLLAIPLTCLAIAYYRKYVLKQVLAEAPVARSAPFPDGAG